MVAYAESGEVDEPQGGLGGRRAAPDAARPPFHLGLQRVDRNRQRKSEKKSSILEIASMAIAARDASFIVPRP
jgi:hypothetical protein